MYREGLDRKFQSTIDRSKFSILKAAIEFFQSPGPLGRGQTFLQPTLATLGSTPWSTPDFPEHTREQPQNTPISRSTLGSTSQSTSSDVPVSTSVPGQGDCNLSMLGNHRKILPCPSFPCFFGKLQGKPPKKQGFFYPCRTPKIPGKEAKDAQKAKEFLAGEKKGIPKKQGKEGQGTKPPAKSCDVGLRCEMSGCLI